MKRFVMIVVPLLLSIGTARAADTDPAAVPSRGDQQITGKRLVLTESPRRPREASPASRTTG
jgi:hypothetical protein